MIRCSCVKQARKRVKWAQEKKTKRARKKKTKQNIGSLLDRCDMSRAFENSSCTWSEQKTWSKEGADRRSGALKCLEFARGHFRVCFFGVLQTRLWDPLSWSIGFIPVLYYYFLPPGPSWTPGAQISGYFFRCSCYASALCSYCDVWVLRCERPAGVFFGWEHSMPN